MLEVKRRGKKEEGKKGKKERGREYMVGIMGG